MIGWAAKRRWGTWLIAGALLGLLGLAIVTLYVGWQPGRRPAATRPIARPAESFDGGVAIGMDDGVQIARNAFGHRMRG
jgi:hypothetical protein